MPLGHQRCHFEILGSYSAAAAAINTNGGSYDAGGTFLAFIDGNGTIAFNNATVHADVLKVGALGTNGVLTIGGGTLSADTSLKLYASSSSGMIDFVANCTLTGAGAKIIAANTVQVENGVTVLIGGAHPADIYTNFANYSSTNGGNNMRTGSFALAPGSVGGTPVTTHLNVAPPPFDDPPPPPAPSRTARASVNRRIPSGTNVTSSRRIDRDFKTANKKSTGTVIKVNDSGELLSLLDRTTPGPGKQITIPPSNRMNHGKHLGRIDAPKRLIAEHSGRNGSGALNRLR